jgi:hypothetical protein
MGHMSRMLYYLCMIYMSNYIVNNLNLLNHHSSPKHNYIIQMLNYIILILQYRMYHINQIENKFSMYNYNFNKYYRDRYQNICLDKDIHWYLLGNDVLDLN